MKKKVAIVAGASGLVGRHLTEKLIADESYEAIYIIGRRNSTHKSSKITFYESDFNSFPSLTIDNQIDFFCTLGTTIKKAETQENFKKIDYHAVVKLAKWADELKAKNFTVISSVGANKKSRNFYLRTKGEMESKIRQYKIDNITFIRPSLITGKRDEFRFGEKLGEYFLMIFGILFIGSLKKYKPISAEKIASKMIFYASKNKSNISIIEGKALHS